jgi:hypothetical protein
MSDILCKIVLPKSCLQQARYEDRCHFHPDASNTSSEVPYNPLMIRTHFIAGLGRDGRAGGVLVRDDVHFKWTSIGNMSFVVGI